MTEFTPEWITKARNACIFFGEPATTEFINALDHIERLQKRIEELEQERRWIPVSEWEQKENVDMLIRVVVRGLKRTFTGYLKDGEWKIPLDWTNSIPVTSNLVTHVMPLPQPPQEEE